MHRRVGERRLSGVARGREMVKHDPTNVLSLTIEDEGHGEQGRRTSVRPNRLKADGSKIRVATPPQMLPGDLSKRAFDGTAPRDLRQFGDRRDVARIDHERESTNLGKFDRGENPRVIRILRCDRRRRDQKHGRRDPGEHPAQRGSGAQPHARVYDPEPPWLPSKWNTVPTMDALAPLSRRDTDFGFVMSQRLGDSLVSMVLVENLRREGRRITVYGDHMHALRAWFPETDIQPLPPDRRFDPRWARHETLLHFRPADVLEGTREAHPGMIILDDLQAHRSMLADMVTVHREISGTIFGIEHPTRDTGLVVPAGLERSTEERIVIHPTAGDPRRAWKPDRYEAVAEHLRRRGWHPEFTTHPNERSATSWIEKGGHARFASGDLDTLARHLIASRGFLGSDSGVAHLASCLGLPFVTLYVRRKVAIRWRPGWSEGEAVRPSWPLVLKPLKERLWSRAISINAVNAAADRVFGSPG